MRRLGWILALTAASGLSSAQAHAALQAVTGGSSTFTFTVDLDALDVDVSANGSAEMSAAGVFVMPITSGVVDLAAVAGSIQHDGSGLQFDFGAVSVDADNLEVDFDNRLVNG